MPEFVNTIDVIGDDALTDCIIDRSIIEYNDDAISNIRNFAFSSCSQLTTVNFPTATSIGANAFSSCSQLTTVNLPAATSIGTGAFRECSQLTTVNLPAATSIGAEAFYNCSKLTALILRNTEKVASYSSRPCYGTPIAKGTGYIYVPAALVDSYKAATGWSTYAAQFRAIEDYPDVCGG
jgi:hypothetical protein